MSTGPTHAVMGLAAWGGVALLALSNGLDVSIETWGACAAITAGAALLPDLDHPPATVSRAFGALSRGASHLVENISVGIYNMTRFSGDPHRDGGHRTFTHTAVFAAVAGVVTTALVSLDNPWITGLLLFLFCGLGVRGLLHEWDHRADTFVVIAGSLIVTAECWRWVHAGEHRAQWCGLAVATGCLAHLVGDALTEDGCPILWPVPLAGRLWYPIGPPDLLRYRTGGKVEMRLMGPLWTAVAVWTAALALQRMHVIGWLDGIPLVPHLTFS